MPTSTHVKRARGGLIVTSGDATPSAFRHPENLPAEQEADKIDLKLLMDAAVTEDDWLDIFRKAKEIALAGGQVGVKAMEFLAKYRWGLPTPMATLVSGPQSKITVIEVIRPETGVEQSAEIADESAKQPAEAMTKQEENVPF